ncbi:helix-turn-helix transcriptional regulator [Paenibacillus sp. S-38]|uniref:helix-turn-helix transcriptional regulator n=1 Tax=Paenibacillus sp. S-38 TaxID=3416710 RepID=UPI003CF7B47F
MHKAQRLVQLIMLVNERMRFTVQELADECGVSRRTMIRDLMELGELGVPLYSEVGAGGGYRVLREKVLPPISFTEQEAMALFFAAQSLRNYKSLPFGNEVEGALHKFFHYLSSDLKASITRMQQRLIFWVPPHELEAPHLGELLEAAIQQQVVTMKYESSSLRERSIQPLGIYTMNGLWYCQAYCFSAGDYRVFRVDRVQSCQPAEDQSVRLDTGREAIEEWIMRPGDNEELVLEVGLTPEGARRCRTDVWLAKSLVLHKDGSGSIRTPMPASYVPWAVHFFLGLGMEAIVKGPKEVREGIRDKLREMLGQYEEKR